MNARGNERALAVRNESTQNAPEELDARLLLLGLQLVGHLVEELVLLLGVLAERRDVHVVEGVVVDAELGQELEGRIDAHERIAEGVRTIVPGAKERLAAEGVGAEAAEGVPVAAEVRGEFGLVVDISCVGFVVCGQQAREPSTAATPTRTTRRSGTNLSSSAENAIERRSESLCRYPSRISWRRAD